MLFVVSLVAGLCLAAPASANAQFTIGDATVGEGDGQAPVAVTDHGAADSLRCIALRLTPDPVHDLS